MTNTKEVPRPASDLQREKDIVGDWAAEKLHPEDQAALNDLAEQAKAERAESEELREAGKVIIRGAEEVVAADEQARLEDNRWR